MYEYAVSSGQSSVFPLLQVALKSLVPLTLTEILEVFVSLFCFVVFLFV